VGILEKAIYAYKMFKKMRIMIPRILGNRWGIVILLLLFTVMSRAAEESRYVTEPNDQYGKCGPYYIWYQTGPGKFSAPFDFVDLYSVTFDISDVVDDFDFVYFTGTRRGLDRNEDGISDWNFYSVDDHQVTWIPPNGQERITQKGCWSSVFHHECGYAMISIQPKPWSRNGSARIPIHVTQKCSQTGSDCSESHVIFHEYANCQAQSLPEFIIRHEKAKTGIDHGRTITQFDITIENTTDEPKHTDVTNSMTKESVEGEMFLYYVNIDCPQDAICKIHTMDNDSFTIKLEAIPPQGEVIISYEMAIDRYTIPSDVKSYFTNTATLSDGESSQVTVGIKGLGGRREERPRQ
jgi:hypothetical protein